MTKAFHSPTRSSRKKDAALLSEIKRQRKAGKYPGDDDDDGQEQNTQKGGKK